MIATLDILETPTEHCVETDVNVIMEDVSKVLKSEGIKYSTRIRRCLTQDKIEGIEVYSIGLLVDKMEYRLKQVLSQLPVRICGDRNREIIEISF